MPAVSLLWVACWTSDNAGRKLCIGFLYTVWPIVSLAFLMTKTSRKAKELFACNSIVNLILSLIERAKVV